MSNELTMNDEITQGNETISGSVPLESDGEKIAPEGINMDALKEAPAGEEAKTKDPFKPMTKEEYLQNYKEMILHQIKAQAEIDKDAVPAMIIGFTNELATANWDLKEARFCLYSMALRLQAVEEKLKLIEERRSKHHE